MHPRRDLWPLRDSVFHVTNSGYCVSDFEVSDCVLGVVMAVELDRFELDDVLEALDGVVAVDESEAWLCRRLMRGI
jgi:hypothetical protein